MKSIWTRRIFAVAALSMMVGLSGCLWSRQIVGAQDNPGEPLTLLETVDTYFYGVYMTATYRFWECEDKGDNMVCQVACDGDTDLTCPYVGTGGVGTEIIR